MAFIYRITIDRDLVNWEGHGIDLLEPGGWVTEPIRFERSRGMRVTTEGGSSRVLEFYIKDTVIRLRTLDRVDITFLEFWASERFPVDTTQLNPPRAWTIELIGED